MCLLLRARKAFVCCLLTLGGPGLFSLQATYVTNGTEYAIAGAKPGDQVHPAIAFGPNGGFLVWEDNITISTGLGISAQRLDANSSAALSSFRVNSSSMGDHERPQVAVFNDGRAAFVWQGGKFGYQHVYARFLSTSNTWLTDDILVNSSTNYYQMGPAVAALANGNLVVIWSSLGQYNPGSLQDVYGQILSPDGQKIGSEFLVNQFVSYNQRTPSVAALSTGGFVVSWVSEQQRKQGAPSPQVTFPDQLVLPSVDIYARIFSASGVAANNEFLVNTGTNVCANPNVTGGPGGGFLIAWGEKDTVVRTDSWDIFARLFSSSGAGGTVSRINTETYGDQFAPQLSFDGTSYLAVWTSLAQDKSMDGVFGQFLNSDGSTNGSEFQVNTTWINKQIHPTVASDGGGGFVVAWSSFIGGSSSFDLFAQRLVSSSQSLQAMPAPFLYVPFITSNGVYQPAIEAIWPAQSGLPVDHYEVYVDGALAASPATNTWTMTAANGLTASSTHSFQVAVVATGGSRTPLSPSANATTWSGYNWSGIPFEWMANYYGADSSSWPPGNTVLAPGGVTLTQVFLTGGNPLNPSTWLHTSLEVQHAQGMPVYMLHWNTQPGLTYQVQTSADMVNWVNFQTPRFAADVADSVPVPNNNLQYYRLVRLR